MEQLKLNRDYFLQGVDIAFLLHNEKKYESCLKYISKLVLFSWYNATGFYTAFQLENLVAQIAAEQLNFPNNLASKIQNDGGRKILHIASVLYEVGGHTPLLFNWIREDSSTNHTVVTTRQNKNDYKKVAEHFNVVTVEYHEIFHESILITAQNLINFLAQNHFDAVILHVHPNDVIPNLVFSNNIFKTPVGLVNHADHAMWLGTAVTDVLIQFKKPNIKVDRIRRKIDSQAYLPLIIKNKNENFENQKKTATINILSTGSEFKFRPDEKYNFFKEAFRIVSENENVTINIAGVYENSVHYQPYKHPRIKCLGVITNLHEYEDKTDIYLEGFPVPSFTALLQCSLKGIPFVLHYDSVFVYQLFENLNEHHISYPDNLEAWHTEVKELIRSEKYRKEVQSAQLNFVKNEFNIENWRCNLNKLYNLFDQTRHSYIQSSDENMLFETDNEQRLLQLKKDDIFHLKNTYELSLLNKFKLFKKSFYRNSRIEYPTIKQIVHYFISNND